MFLFKKNRTESAAPAAPAAPVAAPVAAPAAPAPSLENPPTKAVALAAHNPAVPRQPLGQVSNLSHPVC